jgi:C4-dicarboxylate transporter, DctM subunit
VVYGFVTQTSIGALFIAGILPGILCAVLMCLAVLIVVSAHPSKAPSGVKSNWGERIKSLKGLWSIIFLFVLVIGGIYSGIFTPTEAAAIGAFVTFVLGLATRQLTKQGLIRSLTGTVKTTAMIFLLVIGAMVFGTFLTSTEITIKLGQFIRAWQVSPYMVMAVILIFYIICGFFMDAFALLIVSLPIVFPIVVDILKFDPIAFGVLCVVTIMIGCITPPVGLVVFAVHGIVKDVDMWTIFKGCTPHVIALCVLLVLLVAFPQISTVLPSMMLPYK